MTDSDNELLNFLKWCQRQPTIRDMRLWCGYSSTSMVVKALERLEDEGHIIRRKGTVVVNERQTSTH